MRSVLALGRYGETKDIAEAVTFLAGPEAKYITGTGILVDGGGNA
jgi:3-oxoacyl-[acyl-carrier protein] reductase